MNKLEKQQPIIKRQNLNESDYFQSILQESYRLNLLSVTEYETIQVQSLQLLAKQVQRYTGGESSSVKVETAQSIMQSILYVIGSYLKTFPEAELGLAALKQKPLLELYQHGKKLITAQLASAKQLLIDIQTDGFITDNQAYNDTIQNAIPPFFTDYDVNFAAHDTPASIDYPLCNDKMDLVGIEYISNYLETLCLENKFLDLFPMPAISRLLQGFNDHHKDLLINIFGLVLTNALGCVLLGKTITLLNIEPKEREYLQQKLLNLSHTELNNRLHKTLRQLCIDLDLSDRSLKNHMIGIIPDLSVRLKNALENNRLESIFISFKDNPLQSVLFEEGNKMDDELFRSIANEIKECRYVSDKIAIIQKEIHSISDFIDILGSYCIFDNEFTDIFQSLGDMELALLLKMVPSGNIIDSDIHFTESEKEWHNRLNTFFSELRLPRQKRIRKLVGNIVVHP
ncbi:DUF6179 domain-containing protein [Desulfosporosinus sp. BG]|uniref:DUF6179 domain-containing protein n=1 Tax=Desulfosporosinus sp. BG TaxID=1633135 RepID=UPI00083B8CEC|nr:DUF6179 domain-containing protein [Desulfosporosinus sp. BG]ODA41024.1 hypothetical protein DSBG_2199 [Desulfosporosinus sp. BG]